MKITLDQLKAICPFLPKNADVFLPYLERFMPAYGIILLPDIQAFIAQLAHESGQFKYTREIASGKAYEGRQDLGNIHPGDGVRFKGRGLIQITGRDNYARCGAALGIDLIANPELLETPQYAVQSACWYWQDHGLSAIAGNPDKRYQVTRAGKKYDLGAFEYLTTRINGWLNGIEDRNIFYERAKQVLK